MRLNNKNEELGQTWGSGKKRRDGWNKYNSYMNQQIDSILSADWASVFEKESVSFGKVDASYLIRKAFGSLCPAI